MHKNEPSGAADSGPHIYEIRIGGHLDAARWGDWFEGLTIMSDEHGMTRLTGPVADQAALYGVLRKIRDLGIPLLAVRCLR